MRILSLNVGSSSLKAALFDVDAGREQRVLAATIVFDDTSSSVTLSTPAGSPKTQRIAGIANGQGAVLWLLTTLEQSNSTTDVAAVAHRLVHDGGCYQQSVWLTPDVVTRLTTLTPLAPAHLPAELSAVQAVTARWPQMRQLAAFDTAFHAGLPSRARLFGLPRAIADSGVVRYGFHGLSYEYVVGELRASHTLKPRVVVAHLGSGASLAAIADGKSIDTTMGFTPTGGVVMATRSGDLDPGVLLYLARTRQLSVDALSAMVIEDGGLAGLSGLTGNMQVLLDKEATPRVAEAIDLYCYQISKAVAAMTTALNGIDTLVFTGGVGEHAPAIRSRVCARLNWLGVFVDEVPNTRNDRTISVDHASVRVHVIPTDEERMIARHAHTLLTTS